MSKDEYGRGVLHTPFQERSILEKHKDKLYFDSQICKEATIKDIDKEKIKWFLKKAKAERNLNIDYSASSLELNKRQKKAIEYLKIHKNITRKIYMEINNISPRQANKDLNDLFEKKLIRKQGRGRAISYVLK